jgi:hypothetical protein
MKHILTLSLILIVVIATSSFLVFSSITSNNAETQPFYLGVSFCGNTTAEAKLLVDRVKNYTNLFVLQSGPISKNETATNEICDYAVDSGLAIIVYFGWFDPDYPWQILWLDTAKQRWGDRLIGVYLNDEQGGIAIDGNWTHFLNDWLKEWAPNVYKEHASAIEDLVNGSYQLRDYDLAAELYINYLENNIGLEELKARSIKAFTSDYALYWWDYLGGYDVLLAQFGWNNTVYKDIVLLRGAARMQNKAWGAIITWKYDKPPYLDNVEQIYEQMMTAYQAGATYIVLFNYPQIEDNLYGILADKHFEMLENFWNDVMILSNMKAGSDASQAEAALVLPRNYGWGIRHPEDRIWYWGPDENSAQIWEMMRKLLLQYGLGLDIVYDDPEFPAADKYLQVYYWNQSI